MPTSCTCLHLGGEGYLMTLSVCELYSIGLGDTVSEECNLKWIWEEAVVA
jgi:hypothetical protein